MLYSLQVDCNFALLYALAVPLVILKLSTYGGRRVVELIDLVFQALVSRILG